MGVELVFRIMVVLCVIKTSTAASHSVALSGCNERCGNVAIPFPFGIGASCSGDDSFVITCDYSSNPAKPYIGTTNVEVLGISLTGGTVSVNNPLDLNSNLSSSLSPFSNTYSRFTSYLDWTYKACNTTTSVCGNHSICSGMCYCNKGFEGNPYLQDGCQDIDECAPPQNQTGTYYPSNDSFQNGTDYPLNNSPATRLCSPGSCYNTMGSYQCLCPSGYVGQISCYKIKDNRAQIAAIVTGTSLGIITLLIGTWWLYKILKRRRKNKLKEKHFKRNGGLLLEQQFSSGEEGNVDKTKLFTSKELEKASDHYNENRILGRGGQGTVYKGMLTDGRIVAIKKSKIENEGEIVQFINEVVILSQINHRNVVRLHGCCLETEVPMLVYEFIPNGTLFDYIHDQNEELPLSCWDMRLRIATEVAGALSYLHSAASVPIYHRDIKSTNILLDDKYRSKVADFGTSRYIAVDQTHLTTRVLGTFGYLDPEYFQSSQFTDKSDVYSFGVVLVELLTGQIPISSTRSQEERGLAAYFILAMNENRLFDIVDRRVMNGGGKEEILGVANIAKRCLNLSGKKRPTMKEVAMELEGIRKSHGVQIIQAHYEEVVEYATVEINKLWDMATTSTTSTGSSVSNNISSSSDVQPLLFQ